MKTNINYWAVIVSAIAATVFGMWWFTMLFLKPYTEGLGRTAEQLSKGPALPVALGFQLAGHAVMLFIFAWLMQVTGNTSVTQAIKLALLMWVGFVACVTGPNYAFQAFSFPFFLIVTVYTLITLLIGAVVLGLWK